MNLVFFGAHPDDAEFFAGGLMIKAARAGHSVLAVSLTNGDIGHHQMSGGVLAQRRRREVEQAAALGGYACRVLDIHDGELFNDLTLRKEVARIIRSHAADLVFCHRPCDYHPDHRNAALAVQDAAFMVTVPFFCPDTPALPRNPVFLSYFDRFTDPSPFRADLALAIDDVMRDKFRLLDAMPSQFYEWLPWLENRAVPALENASLETRLAFLETCYGPILQESAKSLPARGGHFFGGKAETASYVEAFQISAYGHSPDPSFFPGFLSEISGHPGV